MGGTKIETLKEILPENLKKGLTPAEGKLLENIQVGIAAYCSSDIEEENNPENAESWGKERTIRSEVLYWLCTNVQAQSSIHTKGIRIIGAKIDGDIDLEFTTILHPLVLISCATGSITLNYAEIPTLVLKESTINTFCANGLKVIGDVYLNGMRVRGGVWLMGADIGSNLECNDATFENEKGYAFIADNFKAKGEVNLLAADIGDSLECDNETIFENEKGNAFNADRLKSNGTVSLKGVKTKGEVRLLGADIGGNLECNGAIFENEKGYAFSADGFKAKGTVFLNEVKAKGELCLLGADIRGDLVCNGATFNNEKDNAFSADSLKAKGHVFLKGVKTKGQVRLQSAEIGGNLECIGATFENEKGNALNLENATIDGTFFLNDLKKITGVLTFMHARVGPFVDDESSWPESGSLYLKGFEYKALTGDKTPLTAKKRLEWLRLQPKKSFYPQPYEQLAKFYRSIGHESEVREVLCAKQEDMRKYGTLSWEAKVWNWFLGRTIGHGYKPRNAFIIILFFLVLGSVVFHCADKNGVMQPSKEKVYMSKEYMEYKKLPNEYPRFQHIVYSIDVFVPFVDLHQESYWLPDVNKPYGKWYRLYFWLHIAAGWVFSTLAAASLTGLIRKE